MKKFNPIESFPPPYNGWCNTDWACKILAEKRGYQGNPQNLCGTIRNAASKGHFMSEHPSRGLFVIEKESFYRFVENYTNTGSRLDSEKCFNQKQMEQLKNVIREVIREEFSK